MDSRQNTSGMTVKSTTITTSTKSALTNDEMNESVQVLSSWMMAKAMWHMDVPSLLLRRGYCAECRITFDVAAPGIPKGLT